MRKQAVCRVALLYHDPLLRDIVRQVLSEVADVQVVIEVPVDQVSLTSLVAARPDVAIVDWRAVNGTVAAMLTTVFAALAERRSRIRVIALSLAEGRATVFSAWHVPQLSAEELVACVRDARRGRAARRPVRGGAGLSAVG
jgi:DNA-binding NarL/FixJ family response regulator